MQSIWNKLNEKKTTIGAGLLLAAMALEQLSGIWLEPAPPEWVLKLVETLNWLGGFFSGVGLTHKGVKKWKQPGANATPQ